MLNFLTRAAWFLFKLIMALCFPQKTAPAMAVAARKDPDGPSAGSIRDGHELSDAKPAVVVAVVSGLLVAIFGTMGALALMYLHLYTPGQAMPVKKVQESFTHAPVAKTSIEKDWEAIDIETRRHLDGYQWADQSHTFLHIPISRAMNLIAREGLPSRAGETPAFPQPDMEKLPLIETGPTQDAR
ncbi:MAG TPA: hypothetical protein VHY22_01020 [Chthoniobacteraceae bacterium]|jgi:hypothetical protein|nr:hypothetical protein [Chthoniobacteraceae bacterium]